MICAVGDCGRPRESNGQGRFYRLCAGHRARKKTRGDVFADIPLDRGAFERQSVDFAQPLDYVSSHQRVHRWRGKASDLPCADCGGAAAEWSYDGGAEHEMVGLVRMGGKMREGRWSANPADYSPRCKPCHAVFDRHCVAA